MKKYRRIVSLVLVFALAFALMATCVSAAIPNVDAVEPCAYACDCGGLYTVYEYEYSKWVNVGTQECIHGGTDEDIVQRRYQYKNLVCNSCGDIYSTTTATQTRLVCPN